ncbi:hypothetical protein T484DRAFT_1742376 [Baffinella frigidus]|nr:hypothetical protein T484DRAFT_1742376 [Cryptophyta sp. CCMP2293]
MVVLRQLVLLSALAIGADGFAGPLALTRPAAGVRSAAAPRRAAPLCLSATASGVAVSRREVLFGLALAGVAAAAPAQSLAADTIEFKDEFAASDGMGVDVVFRFPKSWKLEQKPGALLVNEASVNACREDPDKCDVGEIIARSIATGDNALLLVVPAGGKTLEELDTTFFKKAVFSRAGKFGAYGAPEDIKFVKDKVAEDTRTLDVKFNTFTPGGTTVAKQCILTAKRVGDEVYLLVAATSKFKSSEPLLRDVAASFAALPTGQPAKVVKVEGLKKSLFLKDNIERAEIEKQRIEEGIY